MLGALMYGARDLRVVEREDPIVELQTDAVIKLAASCVCGSDLWLYRGIESFAPQTPMGHEYCGTVIAVGSDVKSVAVGDFVIGSFFASDNTCEICKTGLQSGCIHRTAACPGGAQSELMRVPLADGTLVRTPGVPTDEMLPDVLACSDVFGTGWFGAISANVQPGKTVAVVGDGAVGLLAVLSAKLMGAETIIAMSRNKARQDLALEFGATHIVTERGDEGVEAVKRLTNGLGAHSVIEAVGTQESMMQALNATRRGGNMGFVGVPHEVKFDGIQMFMSHVQILGGPAPVRQYLPDFMKRVWEGSVHPGKVFDLTLPLKDAAAAYEAMDQRKAIKAFLTV